MPALTTQRLYVRRWQAGDRARFAELNGDPEVVRHFPAPLTRRATDELADRLEATRVPGLGAVGAQGARDGMLHRVHGTRAHGL